MDEQEETEEIDPRDHRAAARAARRAQSLYEGRDEAETKRLIHTSQTRTSNYRWAPGEDPNDPDATPESGWEYIRPIVTETEPDVESSFKSVRGTDAKIRCWICRAANYLIIDERTPQQVAESRPAVEWALKNNRKVSPDDMPREFMLMCPQCQHGVQMIERVLLEQQAKEALRA